MALWLCGECGTAYSVGAPCCPQCRGTDYEEDGMPRSNTGGVSYEPGREPDGYEAPASDEPEAVAPPEPESAAEAVTEPPSPPAPAPATTPDPDSTPPQNSGESSDPAEPPADVPVQMTVTADAAVTKAKVASDG